MPKPKPSKREVLAVLKMHSDAVLGSLPGCNSHVIRNMLHHQEWCLREAVKCVKKLLK